ncbi:MAG: DNA-3-methyladenine glycosylase [Flavobacteriales bacterium]|nr:DNA-3-methyladenine glycosylase [Flavobacteriales bacterium]
MNALAPLPESFFYEKDALHLAPALLGKIMVVGDITARITEVEAYMGHHDMACHAANGKRTKRNEVMFHRGGVCYVYLIYGMYHCINIVSGEKDSGEAVLLRSIEIIQGVDAASQNRYNKTYSLLSKTQKKNLANGPGKLSKALGITLQDNELPCFCGRITILSAPDVPFSQIKTTPRIGVDYAGDDATLPWRFLL